MTRPAEDDMDVIVLDALSDGLGVEDVKARHRIPESYSRQLIASLRSVGDLTELFEDWPEQLAEKAGGRA